MKNVIFHNMYYFHYNMPFFGWISLPCSIRCRFTAAQCARLPYTVDYVVANGTENQRELSWQIIQVQRANTWQVGPQVSVDPRTFDAYESSQIQTGPGWILRERGYTQQIRLPLHLKLFWNPVRTSFKAEMLKQRWIIIVLHPILDWMTKYFLNLS